MNRTVKWLGWNEWPEIPPGWIFKISKMLWGSGWKERQELPSGWSFKGRRMPRWSEGKERPKFHLGGRSSSEAGQEKSAARRQESSIGDDRSSQVSPGCK